MPSTAQIVYVRSSLYASREVICGMLTKVCRARINFRVFSIIRSQCEAIFSHAGCSQGGKVTYGNKLSRNASRPTSIGIEVDPRGPRSPRLSDNRAWSN